MEKDEERGVMRMRKGVENKEKEDDRKRREDERRREGMHMFIVLSI